MQRQLRMLSLPCYRRHVLKHSLVMFWHKLEPCCLNLLPWQGRRQCSALYFLKILWRLPKSASQLKSNVGLWQLQEDAVQVEADAKATANVVLAMLSIPLWHLLVMFWSDDEHCFSSLLPWQSAVVDSSSRRSHEKCPNLLINFNVALRHCRKMQPKL